MTETEARRILRNLKGSMSTDAEGLIVFSVAVPMNYGAEMVPHCVGVWDRTRQVYIAGKQERWAADLQTAVEFAVEFIVKAPKALTSPPTAKRDSRAKRIKKNSRTPSDRRPAGGLGSDGRIIKNLGGLANDDE